MKTKDKVERAIAALEAAGADITSEYAAWRDVGFALTDEFGEEGREYFHRISRMYPQYDAKACDDQFDRCLRSQGQGISIGTFFHLVKAAGVQIPPAQKAPQQEALRQAQGVPRSQAELVEAQGDKKVALRQAQDDTRSQGEFVEALDEEDSIPQEEVLPLLPEAIFPNLPVFLQKLIAPAGNAQERDMLLLGALAILSACFPKVLGYYDGKKVMSNLYIFIAAKASSGKGILNLLKKVVLPIHGEKRQETLKMKQQAEASESDESSTAETPVEKMLFLPANSSSTGMFQLLHDNDGQGLIFETEGDTLTQTFKSDYGNYSDGFRKAFHHETISYYRRTDREYVDIEEPCLSALLTGTPQQIHSLIPAAENGLFSRFLFYYIDIDPEWKDVFANSKGKTHWQYYMELGKEFFDFWKTFQEEELHFSLTPTQQMTFNSYFAQTQQRYFGLFSDDYIATVRRLGLIAFRMAMLFSVLRRMEESSKGSLESRQDDFESALAIISVLVQHSSRIFRSLPINEKGKVRPNIQEQFLDTLPESFTRQDYLEIGKRLGIHLKSSDRYIGQFIRAGLLLRIQRNYYERNGD